MSPSDVSRTDTISTVDSEILIIVLTNIPEISQLAKVSLRLLTVGQKARVRSGIGMCDNADGNNTNDCTQHNNARENCEAEETSAEEEEPSGEGDSETEGGLCSPLRHEAVKDCSVAAYINHTETQTIVHC